LPHDAVTMSALSRTAGPFRGEDGRFPGDSKSGRFHTVTQSVLGWFCHFYVALFAPCRQFWPGKPDAPRQKMKLLLGFKSDDNIIIPHSSYHTVARFARRHRNDGLNQCNRPCSHFTALEYLVLFRLALLNLHNYAAVRNITSLSDIVIDSLM
jgi:hypothetical protein